MRILTMGYSGDGLRAWKQSSSGRTYFLYDGADPACELNASESGSSTDPFGYGGEAGYYTDHETGLVLLTHRYYDPATATFLTRDPIGYAGGINLYGYVGDNPVNWTDPSGLKKGDPNFGYPRDFWNWLHNPSNPIGKKPGEPDYGPDDAKEDYETWVRQGKPKVKTPRPSPERKPETPSLSNWMADHSKQILVGAGVGCVVVIGLIVAPEITVPALGTAAAAAH